MHSLLNSGPLNHHLCNLFWHCDSSKSTCRFFTWLPISDSVPLALGVWEPIQLVTLRNADTIGVKYRVTHVSMRVSG